MGGDPFSPIRPPVVHCDGGGGIGTVLRSLGFRENGELRRALKGLRLKPHMGLGIAVGFGSLAVVFGVRAAGGGAGLAGEITGGQRRDILPRRVGRRWEWQFWRRCCFGGRFTGR